MMPRVGGERCIAISHQKIGFQGLSWRCYLGSTWYAVIYVRDWKSSLGNARNLLVQKASLFWILDLLAQFDYAAVAVHCTLQAGHKLCLRVNLDGYDKLQPSCMWR